MPQTVEILIIEDDGILALDLGEQLADDGYRITGVAATGRKALELFTARPPDLVLCDVSLRGDWDGIETAHRLMQHKPVPLIYLTALSDRHTIERAKATFPAAYMTKPFAEDALRLAIELALHNFAQRTAPGPPPDAAPLATGPTDLTAATRRDPLLMLNGTLFVKQNYQFVKIQPPDILYLKADDSHTTIVTTIKKYALRLSLKITLRQIDYPQLVQTHRSFAVNLDRIESFANDELLVGGCAIPVGRNYRIEFARQFSAR